MYDPLRNPTSDLTVPVLDRAKNKEVFCMRKQTLVFPLLAMRVVGVECPRFFLKSNQITRGDKR